MERLPNFHEELEKKTKETEQIIYRYLPEETGFASALAEAMNYSMKAGGKRLRPLLLWETYQLFGGTGTVVQPFMAAIEMIHTHSLIHDDLPAIDNDEFRRGRKTTHRMFGEALGVLSGDALLNYAYETALCAFSMVEDPGPVVYALRILAQKTGISGMLGGQSVDVTNEKEGRLQVDRQMLDYIYENKTSALIEASMMAGALLAGALPEEVQEVEKIASATGIAFQIRDDILDVISTTEELGKPVQSDKKNQKTTYVTLFGVDGAEKEAVRYTNEALGLLEKLKARGEKAFLQQLLFSLASRKK